MAKIFYVLILLTTGFLSGCGSDSDDNDDTLPQQEEQLDQGVFEAKLSTLNTSRTGSISGIVRIQVEGDEVRSAVGLTGAPITLHPQYIYSGRACPSSNEDINDDGRIDFNEASLMSGNILIPLDNNIESQLSGGAYPFGKTYSYFENGSLARMLEDLRAPDPAPSDRIVKLGPDESLSLEGRVVMVHGITRDSSFPIACGLLVRVGQPGEVLVPNPPTPVPPQPRPIPSCPVETSFSTRISSNLLIAGVRCRGGETAQYSDTSGTSRIFICQRDQWLLTVDNVNTCTTNGACTEIGVPAFVGYLKKTESHPPEECTYHLRALSPVSDQTRQELNRYQVRFYDDQSPLVIPRWWH